MGQLRRLTLSIFVKCALAGVGRHGGEVSHCHHDIFSDDGASRNCYGCVCRQPLRIILPDKVFQKLYRTSRLKKTKRIFTKQMKVNSIVKNIYIHTYPFLFLFRSLQHQEVYYSIRGLLCLPESIWSIIIRYTALIPLCGCFVCAIII